MAEAIISHRNSCLSIPILGALFPVSFPEVPSLNGIHPENLTGLAQHLYNLFGGGVMCMFCNIRKNMRLMKTKKYTTVSLIPP